MKLLLDTHALLWWLTEDRQLARNAWRVIENPTNHVFVSAVAAWEITIKQNLGKLDAPDDLPEQLQRGKLRELPISVEHALAAGQLPLHHKDPFDRMLVAQAMLEDLTLVTRDPNIARYDVKLLTA